MAPYGVEVVYFPYTVHTSSTHLRALIAAPRPRDQPRDRLRDSSVTVLTTVAARVDDRGIHVRTAGDEPLVLHVDGRYIWAFTPARDGHAHKGGVWVEWPRVLRPFLDGPGASGSPTRRASACWSTRT